MYMHVKLFKIRISKSNKITIQYTFRTQKHLLVHLVATTEGTMENSPQEQGNNPLSNYTFGPPCCKKQCVHFMNFCEKNCDNRIIVNSLLTSHNRASSVFLVNLSYKCSCAKFKVHETMDLNALVSYEPSSAVNKTHMLTGKA